MTDFRQHKDIIRKAVAAENEKDPNWKWSVQSVSKSKVHVKWGYLEYLEVEKPYFSIEVDAGVKDVETIFILLRNEQSECIGASIVGDKFFCDCNSIETGLPCFIERIAAHAHNVY